MTRSISTTCVTPPLVSKSGPRERIASNLDHITLRGWPSRSGVIILQRVAALDFEFLGLDPVNVNIHHNANQDTEDEFCQQLLLLGAKGFDNSERWQFVAGVANDDDRYISIIEMEERAAPSRMERRWVSVAHVPEGGFWAADIDTCMYGITEKYNLLPAEAIQVQLARNISEKAEILKMIAAKLYANLDEYSAGDGAASLNAWKTKSSGELGRLLKE